MRKKLYAYPKMALDLSLLRFSLLSRFAQGGEEEPPRARFVRRSDPLPTGGDQESGGDDDPPQKQQKPSRYRSLVDITIGDVGQALQLFEQQVALVESGEWIARNYFCNIPLQNALFEQRPPVVFGRVGYCYPTEGMRGNLQQMEMYFPRNGGAPDLLQIRRNDINHNEAMQSYRLGVKLYLSKREKREFEQDRALFMDLGYAPFFETGFGDLLEINQRVRPSLPWIYVFGSEWFATIEDTWQVDVKQQIEKLLHWNRVVLNYHPKRYLLQYKSLNDEMDFNPGFSDHYLFTPQDIEQTVTKLDIVFGEKFLKGLG